MSKAIMIILMAMAINILSGLCSCALVWFCDILLWEIIAVMAGIANMISLCSLTVFLSIEMDNL